MFSAAQLESASRRLCGQIVRTPLIGGLHLPGFVVPPELRIKPEVLQPSGSIHARGAMHYLMRRLGQPKGIVVAGAPRLALAVAWAGAVHRMPAIVCLAAPVTAGIARLLDDLGCEAIVAGDPERAEATARQVAESRGFHRLSGSDDPDYALGIASIAVELASDLPEDCADLFVAPADLRAVIEQGLLAMGRRLRCHATAPVDDEDQALAAALATGQRLCVDAASAAALHCAVRHAGGSSVVVLGE